MTVPLILEKTILQDLEFDKISDLVEYYCLSTATKANHFPLKIYADLTTIKDLQNEVAEGLLALQKREPIPLTSFETIHPQLKLLRIEDYVLSLDDLIQIRLILANIQRINLFFDQEKSQNYPILMALVRHIGFEGEILNVINKIIDPIGEIRTDASEKLIAIRKILNGKQAEIDREFRKILMHYRQLNYLAEAGESVRNGRRVMAVLAEYKRQLLGIVHDESASGKTVFIEPQGVIHLNNEFFEAQQEEKREIYRILKTLCKYLSVYVDEFYQYEDLLIALDLIQAKAKLSFELNATAPVIVNDNSLHIVKGKHPLLFIRNKGLGKPTISFDLRLDKYKILLISGPNAGGKSITLKSIGLLQLMVQAGMPVPVAPGSTFKVFNSLYTDIGDHQSIEEDLSTYSSHLKMMDTIVRKADENSLVLLDEFGSGTEPKMGGAIAEGVLKSLIAQKCFAAITSHYSNLKLFAWHSGKILNGAMEFDKETLSPTYHLKLGKPGSSYAFEIAQKVGLSKEIIEYARKRIGKNEHSVDELLIELQNEKLSIDLKLKEIVEKQKVLDRLIKTYENAQTDFEVKRKKLKLETKEIAIQKTDAEERAVQSLLKEIKKEKEESIIRQKMATIKAKKSDLLKEADELIHQINTIEKTHQTIDKEIEAGDFVRVRSTGVTGEVDHVQKGKAIVVVGQMRMRFQLKDLAPIAEPIAIQRHKSVSFNSLEAKANYESKIDIRGMRKDEAMQKVQQFIDKALMVGESPIVVLHGKGDGVLRQVVREVCRTFKGVTFSYPEDEEGGSGNTIIEL